jgi:hypothetical protein
MIYISLKNYMNYSNNCIDKSDKLMIVKIEKMKEKLSVNLKE